MTAKGKVITGGLIIITIAIIMGLFSFLRANHKDGRFVIEAAYKSNCAKQMQMTPKTLNELRKLNVTPDQELKLEFFFYTNTADKAAQFANQIRKLNYEVKHGISAGDDKLFIVTGWTSKMKMSEEVVTAWTKQMCDLGYEYDCEFDGWGTQPEQ